MTNPRAARALSDGLVHLLREPAGEPAGALVLNHGRGADEHDLFGLLDELDPERRLLGVTTGAPLTNVPPGGRHWYLVPRVGYPDPATFAASYDALTGLPRRPARRARDRLGANGDRRLLDGRGDVLRVGARRRPSVAGARCSPSAASSPRSRAGGRSSPGREALPVLIHHGRQRSDHLGRVRPPRERAARRAGGSTSSTSRPTPGTGSRRRRSQPARELVARARG